MYSSLPVTEVVSAVDTVVRSVRIVGKMVISVVPVEGCLVDVDGVSEDVIAAVPGNSVLQLLLNHTYVILKAELDSIPVASNM